MTTEVFKRSWYDVFLAVIILPPATALGIAGGLLIGLRTPDESNLQRVASVGLGSFLVLGACSALFLSLRVFMRMGSPLAIILPHGIEIPHNNPRFVHWSEVENCRTFNVGRSSFLELCLREPNKVYVKRRGWWHGPWRDSVTIKIPHRCHPLVGAVAKAHANRVN